MMITEDADADWMSRALALAETARGYSSPNPPVGAVIVDATGIIGQGATQPVSGPHAEIVALHAAGERARNATMYVTLEPHSFHGHTPPCTEAIIAAGIARVVIATLDPNLRVHGEGVEQLRAAGIEVVVGPGQAAANRLIAPFAHWLRTGQPMGIAKFAMSLDGKIATRGGESQWITGPAARTAGHRLRQACDVILVGSGTALADDPLLTTRLPDLDVDKVRHPLRVLLDSRGRVATNARMLMPKSADGTAMPGAALVATTAAAPAAWRAALAAQGTEVALLPADEGGHVDLAALWQLLGTRGALTVLIEGGSGVLGATLAGDLVQQVVTFIAPRVIGGVSAPGPVGEPGWARLDDALRLRWDLVERVGEDIMVTAEVVDRNRHDTSPAM